MPSTIGLGALSSFLFDTEMDQMAGFVIETERAYQLSVASTADILKKALENDPNGDHSMLKAQHHAAVEELGKTFPPIASASSFIMVYSMMENQLAFYCQALHKSKGYKVSVNDLAGKGIDQSLKYLSKVCDVDVPQDTVEWKEIKDIRQLRNIVVHNRGTLESKHDDLKNRYILKTKGLSIGPYNQVILSKEYCLAVIRKIQAFMNTVADLLPNDV